MCRASSEDGSSIGVATTNEANKDARVVDAAARTASPAARRSSDATDDERRGSSSPVRSVDPVVRALLTVMYGLVVHFGTLWTIESSSSSPGLLHAAADDDGVADAHDINYHDMIRDRDEAPRQHHPGWFSSVGAPDDGAAPHDDSHPLLRSSDGGGRRPGPGWLLALLFLHEFWVYLQHANVFGNPLLQHLDRQYGIALLRSDRHWSIAGTLSAYWARESLGMFLCLPFLTEASGRTRPGGGGGGWGSFTATQYLILYSLVYHTVKSRGVRKDALARSSPRFGIMRLVIDKFYTHSSDEWVVTIVRLFLQGFDTLIHFRIVRDLVLGSVGTPSHAWFVRSMHVLFFVWVVHAALNQLFRRSTASVMVRAWHSLAAAGGGGGGAGGTNSGREISGAEMGDGVGGDAAKGPSDGGGDDGASTDGSASTDEASTSDRTDDAIEELVERNDGSDEDFVVRRLLHHQRVDDGLKGRQGAASDGVDKAVRLETAIAILASFFMLGLGEVPLGALSAASEGACAEGGRGVVAPSALPRAWLLGGLLYGLWAAFLKARSPPERSTEASDPQRCASAVAATGRRRAALIRVLDLAVMIGVAARAGPREKWRMLLACVFLTGKAFLQSTQIERPRLVWKGLVGLEFAVKLAVLRTAPGIATADSVAASSALAVAWAIWVVSHPAPTPCEVEKAHQIDTSRDAAADAVFLGHPALLTDAWALWLLPYPLRERWRTPSWSVLLWPFHYLVGRYACDLRRRLFGDGASFFVCDDVCYGPWRTQNWVAAHFGRHFVTHPRRVKENIEAAARHAERTGVRVLCLGALNKAESINGGGMGVVKALGPDRRLSVIHGNHLTAAAVVETIRRCFGGRKARFFLTGASSKVGWAVARALRDRHGHEVLCHSTDAGRRRHFEEHGFAAASTLAEGLTYQYWIVGKYDTDATRYIPQDATAVVFSVPHSLGSRRDVRVIEAGTLHMDLSRLDRPRRFTNKLREHEIFACHAASVVAAHRLDRRGVARIDEVGPVDPNAMDGWLDDAKKLGFLVPRYEPVLGSGSRNLSSDKPPVAIVGAGPSGLAVAAYLSRKRVPHVLLEAEEDPDVFGSWGFHFAGLEITTQKKWCNLPGFSMCDKEYPGETVTAKEYQRYLKQYSQRYALNIQRGVRVKSIEKGTEKSPFFVKTEGELDELAAWAVVDATGKHRLPRRNTSDDVAGKFESSGISHIHSTEMCDEATWTKAIEAARNGRLCLVGFGNSAADLATAILLRCPTAEEGDSEPAIHVAARTVPPVFPRRAKFLWVDTLGYVVRWLPDVLQDLVVKTLWWGIPGSRTCDSAFPSHLKRWDKIRGRVPVIDKHRILAAGFRSGRLVGHGPVADVSEGREVRFRDRPSIKGRGAVAAPGPGTRIDMAILATGYREDGVVGREDRLNGTYKCGFGRSDRFLPLRSIGEEARRIAEDVAASY